MKHLFLLLCVALSPAAGLNSMRSDGGSNIIEVFGDASDSARSKRSTDDDDSSSHAQVVASDLSTAFHLNNSHLHLMVHWPGAGSDVMFCLARDTEMKPGATSRFFMSMDNGKTFTDESKRLRIPGPPAINATVTKFYQHPLSSCHYVFADTVHKYIFTSTDCGATFTAHKLEMTPELIEFDKSKEKVFLVHDLLADDKKLYVTKNFGETFSYVHSFVKTFFFKDVGAEQSVLYVERLEPTNKTTALSSINYFERQVDTHVVYSGAVEFFLREEFMFVTRPRSGDDHAGELELLVSANGERFATATFPNELPTLDFHVIDATKEGQLMIAVNHGASLSNVYTSVKITPYEVEFSLSLERVMYYNPKVTWHDSWLADTAGSQPFADFYKIQGLRGIYVASQIRERSMKKEEIEPEDLISLITFDQGASWSPIQGPETDEEGRAFPACSSPGGCSLHVSQQLSKRFPSSRSIPLLSSKSAVGVVMATGNMGEKLSQRSNVFMSADAGLSWHQVLKGSYYFNLGDHGGILVAVKYFKTEGPTNELLYSTNEGIEWHKLKFHDKPLRIFGLLTEPGENTTTFTMFGTAADGSRGINWIIVTVDLGKVFERSCTDDDYKRWSPSDGSKGKHRNCILGRKEVYERRAVKANCYNGLKYERVVTVENCACDRHDFICDFGFKKGDEEGWIKNCIKNDKYTHDAYLPPADCKPGDYFNRTRGYIKMRGDSCLEGKSSLYEPLSVACPIKEEKEFLLVSQRKSLLRLNLRNLEEVETVPLQVAANVISLEFDMEDNCVMFADIDLDKIFMQCLNGTAPRVLVESQLESVEGMSYDWISKTLYFVDGVRKTIELVRVDLQSEGRLRKTVLHGKQLGKPRGLAVHPLMGYLFFSDWNEENPYIGRANMDGTDVKKLHTSPTVQWPNGLAIDFIAHRIYWVEAQKDFIASSDLDGKNFKKVIERNNYMKHPFAVGVYKEMMYWDDWHTKSVYMADKNSGKGLVPLITKMEGAMDLKIFSSIHRSGNNSCSSNPCSHLCTPMPNNKFICLCPDGMKSGEDNQCQCPDGSLPDSSLRCSQTNGSCQEIEFSCANGFCIPKLWKCDGEDDCGDRTDEADCVHDECKEFHFQCQNRKCIPNNWRCDFDDDCGDNSDENNCNNSECTKDQFKCDNGQCISKKWHCDLEKDCQDGSDEKNCTTTVTKCKDEEFQCPEGGQCLPNTWKCDGDNDCPGGADEQECDSQKCKDWQFTCANGHCIFSTWRCDNETDCTDGSDEVNCTGVIREQESEDIPLHPEMPVPVFPKGQCNEWMFKCKNEQCIPFWWKCDGAPDCEDASDELECHEESAGGSRGGSDKGPSIDGGRGDGSEGNGIEECAQNQFECSPGECVYQAWVCDGADDCNGGEDENPVICKGRTPCTHDQFRCERSGECLDFSRLCNQQQDCTDGSDEFDCGPGHELTPQDNACPIGYASCDESICYSTSKICDGHRDCYDGTDEVDCGHKTGGGSVGNNVVMNLLQARKYEITATTIRVEWSMAKTSIKKDLSYQAAYAVLGTDKWMTTEWLQISNFTYVFRGLQPYTMYNLTLNMRSSDGAVFASNRFAIEITLSDRPERPVITEVKQIDQKVQVSWVKPHKPNGELLQYIVFMSPPEREWEVSAEEDPSLLIDAIFKPDTNYTFTVTAVNNHFHGEKSKPWFLVYSATTSLSQISDLRITTKESTARLSWDALPEAQQYKVTVNSSNPVANPMDLSTKNLDTTIHNLSPNTTYTFSVSAMRDGKVGPARGVMGTTSGRSLPRPIITDARLTPDKGTSVKLSWKLPADEKRRDSDWSYGIYYGTKSAEMLNNGAKKVVSSDTTSFTVDGLIACESYSFLVAIVGDKGRGPFGPASRPVGVATKSAPGAPPKNVQAQVFEKHGALSLQITWDASCPTIDSPLGYIVSIRDPLQASPSNRQLTGVTKTSNINLTITENIRYGTSYEITVQASVSDATVSEIYTAHSPPIPPPSQLTHHIASPEELKEDFANGIADEGDLRFAHLVYWAPAEDLPNYIADQSYTYKLYISKDSNMSDPKVISVEKPPYLLRGSELEPGRNYFLAVALVDSDGYSSPLSSLAPIETPVPDEDIVVSRNGVAGVLIPMFIVVCILGAALGYYVHKNRRITRNFQAFASRYSPASGAAILNQASLDDDDDSPIIRGFSDNEPLVIT